MGRWQRTTACERARQWFSLDLDDELDELGRAGLARHLDRCEACRVLQEDIASLTELIRAAPAVTRSTDEPVRVRRSRSRSRGYLVRGIALASAVSTLAAAVMLSLPQPSPPASAFVFLNTGQQVQFTGVHTVQLDPVPGASPSAPEMPPTHFRTFPNI